MALKSTLQGIEYYYYQSVQAGRTLGWFAGPNQETVASIYYDIEEGTHIEYDAVVHQILKVFKRANITNALEAYYGRINMQLAVKYWKRARVM